MADYIDRETMIEEIRFVNSLLSPENDWLHGYKTGLVAAIDAILDSNAADVVPVVRCKYCKHSSYDEIFGNLWCNYHSGCRKVKDDGYCDRGERKEGAE